MKYYELMKEKASALKGRRDVILLAVETSCDETSAAVVRNGREVLSNIISSQIDIHKAYGGVVPEIASRKHAEAVSFVIDQALASAGVSKADLDGVAVTYGPGLVGALLIGVSAAKALAFGLSVPLIGVHHIEGHISANYIQHKDFIPPFVCLVVSGGHTMLLNVKDYCSYEIIGQTRDDAAGEAFDKVARTLGLQYPGGPAIDKLAAKGNPYAVDFPRVNIKDSQYDFSFSGLKTAVINYIHTKKQNGESVCTEDIAASFQQAVVDVLVEKAVGCAMALRQSRIAVAGGVAANSALKRALDQKAAELGIEVLYPAPVLCTDNAAMIGCAGYYRLLRGDISDLSLNAVPYIPLS